MSVINNVLKELDGRPSLFTPLDPSIHSAQSLRKNRRKWLWIPALMIVCLVLMLLWRILPQWFAVMEGVPSAAPGRPIVQTSVTPRPTRPVMKKVPQPMSVSRAGKAAVPVTSNADNKPQVSGMQINEGSEFIALSLPLAADAQVFLRRHTGHEYVFTLNHNERAIIVPEIRDNPWLDKVQLEKTAQGTAIRFDVAERVLVQTDYVDDNGRHQWRIRFTRQASAPKAARPPTASKKIVKTAFAKAAASVATSTPGSVHADDRQQYTAVKLRIKALKKTPTAEQRYRQALQAMRQGKLAEARNALQHLLDGKLDRPARLSLLRLYRSHHLITARQRLLAQSLERYPQDQALRRMDAAALFGSGKYERLLARYGNESADIAIINFIAAAQQAAGDHAAAIESYRKALRLDPQQPRDWISLAISLEQQKHFDTALQAYTTALQKGSLNQRLRQFIHDRIQQLSAGR